MQDRVSRRCGNGWLAPSLVAGLFGAAAAGCSEPIEEHPNVVLIIVDTLRADAILDPKGRVDTPNIDAFAKDGVSFSKAFSHAPMTLPSHVALFSSREPHRSGVVNNYRPVPQELPLFPQWMGDHGYKTSAAVSMGSLWAPERETMVDRGFDRFMRSMPWLRPAADMDLDFDYLVPTLVEDQPFFLFAHYGDPHTPLNSHGGVNRVATVSVGESEPMEVGLSQASFLHHVFDVPPGGAEVRFDSEDEFRIKMLKGKQLAGEMELELGAPAQLADGSYELTGRLPNARGKASCWVAIDIELGSVDAPDPFVVVDEQPVAGVRSGTRFVVGEEIDLSKDGGDIRVRSADGFTVTSFVARGWANYTEISVESGVLYRGCKALRARIPNDSDEVVQVVLNCWIADELSNDEFRDRYSLEVEHVDGYIGKFLDRLKELELYDESLIIFTSDHGEGLGQHGWLGHVNSVYDELIHVPLIVKPPLGHADLAGLRERSADVVRHMDLGPTILRIANVPPLPGQRGNAIVEGGPRVHFAETREPEAPQDMLCLRDDEFKLAYYREEDRFELYDMRADPNELKDLYGTRENPRAQWEERLREMSETYATGEEKVNLDRLKALGY